MALVTDYLVLAAQEDSAAVVELDLAAVQVMRLQVAQEDSAAVVAVHQVLAQQLLEVLAASAAEVVLGQAQAALAAQRSFAFTTKEPSCTTHLLNPTL